MQELYDLKEMLCKELKDYGKKDELSAGSLATIDTLAHAIKNLDKVIDAYEEGGYSERGYSMNGGYRYPMDGGGYRNSYSRRRDSMGRYSRDGYSRHDGMADELRELMKDAPESVKHDLQRVLDKIEQR